MINNFHTQENPTVGMPWYKVPILWLMISLLGFTVIGGINLFILAHDTNDSVILEKNQIPLSKKLAFPDKQIKNKN